MLGLTNLGVLHTAIALAALAAAATCFVTRGVISLHFTAGRVYVLMTVLTCLTGFFIFEHGGFGKPHVLGIVTLIVLAIAAAAGQGRWFGRAAPYVATIGYSATVFFHMIPAIAEGGTRLPPDDPWLDHPEAPEALLATGLIFMLFLAGAAYQAWRVRGEAPKPS